MTTFEIESDINTCNSFLTIKRNDFDFDIDEIDNLHFLLQDCGNFIKVISQDITCDELSNLFNKQNIKHDKRKYEF